MLLHISRTHNRTIDVLLMYFIFVLLCWFPFVIVYNLLSTFIFIIYERSKLYKYDPAGASKHISFQHRYTNFIKPLRYHPKSTSFWQIEKDWHQEHDPHSLGPLKNRCWWLLRFSLVSTIKHNKKQQKHNSTP